MIEGPRMITSNTHLTSTDCVYWGTVIYAFTQYADLIESLGLVATSYKVRGCKISLNLYNVTFSYVM